jgi:cobalt-zinc-cadmium efflux system protein
MAHSHSHGPARLTRAFAIGIVLNLAFVAIEAGYGLLANSLALVADAGHNLSDVLGLVLAWVAVVLGRRLPTRRHTYGLGRSSILAALANATLLLIAVGAIALEAVRRFNDPAPIATGTVIWVAGVGIVVNGVTALLFHAGRKHDLNVRGAFLHMVADAAVSLGVVVSGIVIGLTGWSWIDPVTSLVIVVVIVAGTWGLLRDSVNLALDAVPEGVDSDAVHRYLAGLPGVTAVHDLHIWGMSTTETALTAHLVRAAGADDALLTGAAAALHDNFGIEHCTIQIEQGRPEYPCRFCPAPLRQREAVA